MYRLSIGITTNMKQSATDWIAQSSQRLGCDSIWIGEDIDKGQDVLVLTSAMVLQAKGVLVGTGILPIATHDIKRIARASQTLSEYSDGNFVMGLGIGGTQDLSKLGIEIRRPVTALREYILTLREIWQGNTVSKDTEVFTLNAYKLGLKQTYETPIFLGVRGPQMLQLAGMLADGVILSGPFPYLEWAVKRVNRAAEKHGRHPREVEKVVWLPTIPTFRGVSIDLAKKVVALVIADTPDTVLSSLDIDREKIVRVKEGVAKSGPSGGIAHINQELLDTFSISGSKEHMVAQFEDLHRIGADEVVIGPPYSGDWRSAVTELFQEVKD